MRRAGGRGAGAAAARAPAALRPARVRPGAARLRAARLPRARRRLLARAHNTHIHTNVPRNVLAQPHLVYRRRHRPGELPTPPTTHRTKVIPMGATVLMIVLIGECFAHHIIMPERR